MLCGCLLRPWIPQISLLLSTTMLGSWDTSSVWWQWADPSHDLQCSTMGWALECPYPRALLQWWCQDHLYPSLWGDGVEEHAGGAFPDQVLPGLGFMGHRTGGFCHLPSQSDLLTHRGSLGPLLPEQYSPVPTLPISTKRRSTTDPSKYPKAGPNTAMAKRMAGKREQREPL